MAFRKRYSQIQAIVRRSVVHQYNFVVIGGNAGRCGHCTAVKFVEVFRRFVEGRYNRKPHWARYLINKTGEAAGGNEPIAGINAVCISP